MTTQMNKSAGVKFKANIVPATRGYKVSYAKGLEIIVPKAIVETARQATQGFVDALVTAETAMKKAFDDVVSVAKKKGLSRSDAGKVIALILGVPSISKAHDDAAIAMSIKLKWQYAARDLVSNRGQVNAGRKDPSDKGVIVADDASQASKPETMEELLTNKKLGALGALIGSRVKAAKEREAIIMSLLADATADEVEAITQAMLAPHKKAAPQPPKRTTRKAQPKLI